MPTTAVTPNFYNSNPWCKWVVDLSEKKKIADSANNGESVSDDIKPKTLNPIKFDLGFIHARNVSVLHRLNRWCFPIAYGESFYQDVIAFNVFSRFIYVSDVVVGAIACRLQDGESQRHLDNAIEIDDLGKKKTLYIMTLSILPAYRRRGLASELIKWLNSEVQRWNDYEPKDKSQTDSKAAIADGSAAKESEPVTTSTGPVVNGTSTSNHESSSTATQGPRKDIKNIALHVQSINTGSIKFYESLGFVVKEIVGDYYGKLEEQSAHYMVLDL